MRSTIWLTVSHPDASASSTCCFPLGAMLQILVDQRRDVLDDRSVAGEKPGGREIADAAQRREVFREVAALAGGDDDRSSTPGEIAAVEVARLFVEEAEVVRRVAGRVQRDQPRVAGGDDLAVAAAVAAGNCRTLASGQRSRSAGTPPT